VISSPSHVVVVGGGALGCATAFWLARAGVRVTLMERDALGEHASGKNAGNLNPIFMSPPPLVPLALESLRMHKILADEMTPLLGAARYFLEPVRRILLAFNDSELAEFEQIKPLFEGRKDFSARNLDPQLLRALEPRLSESVVGGLMIEGNFSLNGHALTRALANGAAKSGAKILRVKVRGVKTISGRVAAVQTDNGDISCDAFVFATGAWVAEIEKWLGISLPVKAVKGQLLHMRLPGEGLRCDLTCGINGLYRRNQNEIWVGGTQEHVGLDETPTDEARQFLLNQAVRIVPEMAHAELLEHTAALRPMTPSGLPIVGKAKGWSNVYIANGGCNKGILLCTGIAQAMSDLILSGQTTTSLHFQNL
jgi:glycine oxidase